MEVTPQQLDREQWLARRRERQMKETAEQRDERLTRRRKRQAEETAETRGWQDGENCIADTDQENSSC